jgi:DNA repair protein RAD50
MESFKPKRKWVIMVITYHMVVLTIWQAQEQRISDREKLISDISGKHNMKGYDYTPLEREKVIEFISRLGDLQKKQRTEFERLQVGKPKLTTNIMANTGIVYSERQPSKIRSL